MVIKTRPKKVWAIAINLNGLWCKKPRRMTWKEELQEYYDRGGDLSVPDIGLVVEPCITSFASENKKDVEIFIQGATAMAKQVVNVAWIGTE